MKPKIRLCRLDPARRLDALSSWANDRCIPQKDHFLNSYPHLVKSIGELGALDAQSVVFIGHAIFGWMPTQLNMNFDSLQSAVDLLQKAKGGAVEITADEISVLAKTFRTTKGDSVVAAAKILHFINPDAFPLWDRHVARRWGVPTHGRKASEDYIEFSRAIRELIATEQGRAVCDVMAEKLKEAGYPDEVGATRLADLILFLPPRN